MTEAEFGFGIAILSFGEDNFLDFVGVDDDTTAGASASTVVTDVVVVTVGGLILLLATTGKVQPH